jgi:hypothetical protein
MRMKDEVCCRDQVYRGCDLCRQYKRRPNVELDNFYQLFINNVPLDRCKAHVMLKTAVRYEGELVTHDFEPSS